MILKNGHKPNKDFSFGRTLSRPGMTAYYPLQLLKSASP